MKATGIVRRIDDLGRVVIPKEIRRTLRIREGEPMEIFTGREGEIILKKYSPMEELGKLAREYAQAVAHSIGHLVCISDHDQIVAASGPKQSEYIGKAISTELENSIIKRESLFITDGKKRIGIIVEEPEGTGSMVTCPILCAGDTIGAVIIVNKKDDTPLSETERKAAQIAAGFLGRQMEQ